MQFERGWRFLAYIDSLCREVNQSGSMLHEDRVAREVVDTIGCLLAEVLYADPASPSGQPHEAMAQCAEEFLAESLTSPVSLSDAVIVADTSTRSLLRAFRKRHGTSPMAFRRRRLRFEAARRDRFVADCGETSVTDVATRYCFEHLGRFAVEYRALFGESPSDTLRR
jgi:transcriptional regulator GlxA family with amidase domain